jgi:hypothetical protein
MTSTLHVNVFTAPEKAIVGERAPAVGAANGVGRDDLDLDLR